MTLFEGPGVTQTKCIDLGVLEHTQNLSLLHKLATRITAMSRTSTFMYDLFDRLNSLNHREASQNLFFTKSLLVWKI